MTDADAGLTLIETLVVLAVIAVVSGATVLSLAPRRASDTETESRRLAMTIQAAADGALAADAPAALTVDADGYAVAPGPRHALPGGLTLAPVSARPLPLALDNATPFDLTVARGDDRWRVRFDGLRATAARVEGGA